MAFNMSTPRNPGPVHKGTQAVRVFGSDADGGEGGLPVVVARGTVDVFGDGPCAPLSIDGFRTTETSWTPLKHEWVISAERIPESGA